MLRLFLLRFYCGYRIVENSIRTFTRKKKCYRLRVVNRAAYNYDELMDLYMSKTAP